MKNSDIKLRLVLTSATLSPQEISSRAKVKPSMTWKTGEPVHPRATNRHKENGCVVEVVDTALSAAAKRLMAQLSGQSATLANLADIAVEVSCVVNVRGAVPELHLEPDVVAFAASINAALDVDVYVLTDTDDGK
jgi:hypothetical protein